MTIIFKMQLDVGNAKFGLSLANLRFLFPSFVDRLTENFPRVIGAFDFVGKIYSIALLILYRIIWREDPKQNDLYRRVWKEENSEINFELKDIASIRPFKIDVPDAVLLDLKSRLERTRFEDPLEDSKFRYGFNSDHLRNVIQYWKSKYQWRKYEQELNKFPQFKTTIEGLDVHFIHIRASQQKNKKVKAIPLLLIHGWPGSSANFHKLIPLLTTPSCDHEFIFDVVCPSVPGFGFSDSPRHTGFNASTVALILIILMDRLKYEKFYIHGSGWGAVTASLMGRYYPYRVKGLHVNMCFSVPRPMDSIIKSTILAICPFSIKSKKYNILFPFKKKLEMLFEETGYLHMQSTKPYTLGCAMADSPAGLAAYILEKVSFDNDPDFLTLKDGRSSENLEELLAMTTILWVNNNFTSGATFFKENLNDVLQRTHERLPLVVPCGVAFFPKEVIMLPKFMLTEMVEDLVSYNVMPRGGHFPEIEEPQLLASNIWNFVQTVENRPPILPFKK